ncbi:MAG: tRNA lysidine(34) synthetase TilS [Spirochaetia bacterium]|nr:tRNA lysidine(34) synthetase TilS [Spirochaetia bacterium]
MPTIEELVSSEVFRFFTEHHIDLGERVAVAFSGGSDSLALLIALSGLLGPNKVLPLYVNHGLRSSEELEREVSLNRKNCASLGLELTVLTLPMGSVVEASRLRGSGVEEAARSLRYSRLEETCTALGCRYLATAHNADDQMETILKRVFQGSGITSLEGIVLVQRGFFSPTTIVRPTLGLTHMQLQQYVEAKGFRWSEDSTNQMECFERNAIRKNLTPAILALYPQAHAGVLRLTSRAKEVSLLLDGLTEQALEKVVFSEDDAGMCLDDFLVLERPIRDTVLLCMFSHVAEAEATRVSYAKVQQVRRALEASKASDRWAITSGKTLANLSEGWFSLQARALPFSFCLPLDILDGQSAIDLEFGGVFSILCKSEDPLLLRIGEGLLVHPVLRSPLEGDRIELEGKTVLLSKLFSEWKIPSVLHKQIPVLEDLTGIVAVFGRFLGGKDRLCNRYKTPLAGRTTNIYSVSKRNESSET